MPNRMFVFRGDSKQRSQYPSDSAPKQLFDANQSTPDKLPGKFSDHFDLSGFSVCQALAQRVPGC
jgi:hypothetical protein